MLYGVSIGNNARLIIGNAEFENDPCNLWRQALDSSFNNDFAEVVR